MNCWCSRMGYAAWPSISANRRSAACYSAILLELPPGALYTEPATWRVCQSAMIFSDVWWMLWECRSTVALLSWSRRMRQSNNRRRLLSTGRW